jgi:hypothetical protein
VSHFYFPPQTPCFVEKGGAQGAPVCVFRGNRKTTLVAADPGKQSQEISANKQQVYEILPPPNRKYIIGHKVKVHFCNAQYDCCFCFFLCLRADSLSLARSLSHTHIYLSLSLTHTHSLTTRIHCHTHTHLRTHTYRPITHYQPFFV